MLSCESETRGDKKWMQVHRRRNGEGTDSMCPQSHKLLYKLLTTICVVSRSLYYTYEVLGLTESDIKVLNEEKLLLHTHIFTTHKVIQKQFHLDI